MLFKPWGLCLNLGIGCGTKSSRLERDIADFDPAVAPPCSSAAPSCDELFRDLSHDVSQWFAAFQDAGFVRPADCDLVGLWLSTLAALPPEDHEWAAWAFLVWGRAPLDELLQGLIDGEAEQIICDAFVELAEVFPLARANELRGQARARLAYLQDCQGRPIPHRPVRRGTANVKERIETALQVPRAYVDLAIWHDAIRAMRWTSNMISRAIPVLRCPDGPLAFLVIHLFSGRRRETDCHSWLKECWPKRHRAFDGYSRFRPLRELGQILLFMEDAPPPLPRWLCECFFVRSTLETFSEARHMPPPSDCPPEQAARWPRPLRSAARLFGVGIEDQGTSSAPAGPRFLPTKSWGDD